MPSFRYVLVSESRWEFFISGVSMEESGEKPNEDKTQPAYLTPGLWFECMPH